jgi:ribonuclease HI
MRIYTDGFTISGNPSSKGGGFTLVREDSKLLKSEEILRPNFTNNEAELLGVVAALEIAPDDDVIVTDSKVF